MRLFIRFKGLTRELTRCAIAGHSHKPFEISEVGSIFRIWQAVSFFSFSSPFERYASPCISACVHFSSSKPIILPLIRHGLIDIQANDLYTYHLVALPLRNQNLLDICIPIYAFSQHMIRPPLVQWNDSLFSRVPTGSLLRAHRHPYYGNRCPFIPENVYGVLRLQRLCMLQSTVIIVVREHGARSTEFNRLRYVHTSMHDVH